MRALTLDRLASIGLLAYIGIGASLLAGGVFWHIALSAATQSVYADMSGPISALVLGLAGQSAIGMWGGGYGGSGGYGGYGGGYGGVYQAPAGTMGGVETTNQPIGTTPQGG